jgi:hypothetical protein
MKKHYLQVALFTASFFMMADAFAGNKDRTGQAGATELLINPWGASTGVFGADLACVKGIGAMKVNIAGLGAAEKTEVGFTSMTYLRGSNVTVNNLALAQKLKGGTTLGVNIMSMNFGDIQKTSTSNPDGGIGSFKPQFFNLTVGFSKEFSKNIFVGAGMTFVSEQIENIKAGAICLETGIQYVSDGFHFGITLRNIGSTMRFSGAGFNVNTDASSYSQYQLNRSIPQEKFELPTYLALGIGYDFYLDKKKLANIDDKPKHRLTAMGSFTSNSFINDYITTGAEYGFKEQVMFRLGYRFEKQNVDNSFYTGLSTGLTVQHKLGEDGPVVAIDYSFRTTQQPANGVHNFTLRFNF